MCYVGIKISDVVFIYTPTDQFKVGNGVALFITSIPKITYEELCIRFSSILTRPKRILSTLQKNILRKIETFSVFELQPFKIIDLVENEFCVEIPVFSSFFFFWFFSIFLKTVGKCLLLTFIIHQGYSLCQWKSPLKFEIEALFRLVMLYTVTKTKKHTSFDFDVSTCIVNSKLAKLKLKLLLLFCAVVFVFFEPSTCINYWFTLVNQCLKHFSSFYQNTLKVPTLISSKDIIITSEEIEIIV
ncbi:hypothetical protein AGLY_006520 [Aphis glycines]|uniref:Uncharacterized protein n=1 Tax=Aphis glycines TaxID=307491 RepID=A0A6G0TRB0_APHGL|nr:hypothetical protein AGLY_006520 [Aphis glycines]